MRRDRRHVVARPSPSGRRSASARSGRSRRRGSGSSRSRRRRPRRRRGGRRPRRRGRWRSRPGSARCSRGCGRARRRRRCRCCWRRARACCRRRRSPRRRRAGRGRGRTRPGAVGASISAAPKRCARQGSGHSSLITTGTPCSGPVGRGGEHLARALGEGLDDGVERRVALLDPRQRRLQQLGRVDLAGGDRRRLLAQREVERALIGSAAPARGRGRARARPRRVSSASSSRIGGQNICVGGADHRQLDLVGLDPEGGEAGGDEVVCAGLRPPSRAGNPTEARLAGIVQAAARSAASGRRGTAESAPQPGPSARCLR